MKHQPIGFRELLERVLPLDELPPPDRLMVERALQSGFVNQLEAAGMMALSRLEGQGVLRRLSAPSAGHRRVLRYQPRDAFEIIAVELPGPAERDGILIWSRALLPAGAAAGLDQVRHLLKLDAVGLPAGPRTSRTRPALLAQLDLAGRELLGAGSVQFFCGQGDEGVPLDAALIESVRARPGTVFYCPDTSRSRRLSEAARREGVDALALICVLSGTGEPLGCLEVRCQRKDPFAPDDLARIALLADACGGVLERAARFEKLVFFDSLTGAYNRAYFEQQATNEMARAQREQSSMALCIADIDDFKTFNTVYGYEAGNQVLLHVSDSLRRGVRPFDTVARWGGEEFAVLLTSPVHAEDVLAVVERLRGLVQRTTVTIEGLDQRSHEVGVTVSIGVALFPDHAENAADLWRVANTALLEAKRPPKNRVVFYRPQARA